MSSEVHTIHRSIAFPGQQQNIGRALFSFFQIRPSPTRTDSRPISRRLESHAVAGRRVLTPNSNTGCSIDNTGMQKPGMQIPGIQYEMKTKGRTEDTATL